MDEPVILITGALTGIGRATAVAFAKKGAKVVVSGRREEAGEALVDELRSFAEAAQQVEAETNQKTQIQNHQILKERKRTKHIGEARVLGYKHVNDGIQKLANEEAERLKKERVKEQKRKAAASGS